MYNTQLKYQPTQIQTSNIIQFPSTYQTQTQTQNPKPPHIPVQPLRTTAQIEQAKSYFLNKSERYANQNIRDWAIFVCGINFARRASDLLALRVSDILTPQSQIKDWTVIRERKTNKPAKLTFTQTIKDALNKYLQTASLSLSDPLFPSRNKNSDGTKKPMTVNNFYRKMQSLRSELNIQEPIGTHTMRKTWASQALANNKDDAYIVAAISKALNHSNVDVTFRYVGIEQDNIDNLFQNNQL